MLICEGLIELLVQNVADEAQLCEDMIALKDKCIHPRTQKPYIIRSSGGIDNSPEGLQVVTLDTCESIR